MPAFVITAAHVIEHQTALAQVARGQLFLDPLLSFPQPVHCRIQFIFRGLTHPQFLGQRGAVPLPGGGQLGTGIEQAFDDHGQHQITLAAALGGNHGIQAELAQGQEESFDMAVGQSLLRRQ